MSLTLLEYIKKVKNKELLPREVVSSYMEKAKNDVTNSFVRLDEEYVASRFDQDDFLDSPLCGAPIGVKDNFMLSGTVSTCGSAILENYKSPYTASCLTKLEQAGGVFMGKTNMDEFAMGSTNESSAFGPVKNPLDLERVPGGSSGGSAAAVASDLCIASLGTDTGGSVRQPAALCGVVGMKPTYGRISRYGIQAMASSLDQVGVFSKNVADAELLLCHLSGFDPKDATSEKIDIDFGGTEQVGENTPKRFALPSQFLSDGLDSRIHERLMNIIDELTKAGHLVEEVDIPLLDVVVATYYIISPAEVSTNMARFDGLRFGLQESMGEGTLDEYYKSVRSKGFGDEVKRRIILGAYVLCAGHCDAYYRKAIGVRNKLSTQINTVLGTYDAIISPTSPKVARKLGETKDDPIQNYLADIYTIPANLCGLPAISLPMGTIKEGNSYLPAGFHLMTKKRSERDLFVMARSVERVVDGLFS